MSLLLSKTPPLERNKGSSNLGLVTEFVWSESIINMQFDLEAVVLIMDLTHTLYYFCN